MTAKYTVQELVDLQIIEKPLDGNHGSIHPTSKDYVEDGIPFIMASDLSNGLVNFSSCKFITEKQANTLRKGFSIAGDILLSHKATIGRTATVQENKYPFLVLTPQVTYYRVKDKQKLNNLYLKYYFDSQYFQSILQQWAGSGSTRAYIGITEQLKLPIILPDIDTQNEIVDIINRLDQKIYINTQINQTLEQIAQALFKSWFVDFDPVRAKAQALSDGLSLEQAELAAMQAISGKTPEELTALSQTQPDRYAELAETAKAFPYEMVEVDGVEVPKGWELKALSDLGQIICGKTPSKSNKEFYGDDVPFIKIPDMHNQVFITQTTDNLSVAGANSQSKKYIPPKSICVSCIATVGLVSMSSKPSHTNQQINSIIPNDEQTSEFLYLSLKQPSMTKYLKDLASGGSATLNLNTKTFSKIEIITPSKEIIDIFKNKVVSIFEKILSNSIENKRLTEVRDLLLPRLLNGEI